MTIGNSVTSIGQYAFSECSGLQSVTFKSIPSIGQYAFADYGQLKQTVIDLKDSEKPYIGTSLSNYPAFTEANYHRSIEPDKWGTIILPFVPESTEGLEFYELKGMSILNQGSLAFTKVETVAAGVPYLFRNTSTSADFTLTKANPAESDFVLTPQDQATLKNDFTMKGSFQSVQLNTTEDPNGNLYYLKDNEFYHANGKINIAPFRAYIEGSGSANAKSFVLMILDSDNGEVNAIPGIMDDNGEIDETEGIYDLSGRKLSAPQKGQVNIIRTKSGKSIKRMF